MSDIKFAQGIYFNRNPKAPDWIIGSLLIDKAKFMKFLRDTEGVKGEYNGQATETINLDIKISKGTGKTYIDVNNFVPQSKKDDVEY